MDLSNPAFREGFIDVIRRYAFLYGYLEVIETCGLGITRVTELVLELMRPVLPKPVRKTQSFSDKTSKETSRIRKFIYTQYNNSPPEVRRAA